MSKGHGQGQGDLGQILDAFLFSAEGWYSVTIKKMGAENEVIMPLFFGLRVSRA